MSVLAVLESGLFISGIILYYQHQEKTIKRQAVFIIFFTFFTLTTLISRPSIESGRESSTFYFDSFAGSDSNIGTKPDSPFSSLSRLNAMNLVPGDRIFLKNGSVWAYFIHIKDSGSVSAPIVISTYGTGPAPRLAPAGEKKPAVSLAGSYIQVSGLHITSTNKGYGFLLSSGTRQNLIENCEVEGAGAGAVVMGTGHIIRNNYIHDLTMIKNTAGGDDDYGAVGIWLNEPVSNIRIYRNKFINCQAQSCDYGTDGGVMETWGNVHDIEFYANYSEGNNGFFESGSLSNATISKISIHHNISVNDVALFVPHSSGKFSIRFSDISYVNNTVYCDISYPIAFFHIPSTPAGFGRLSVINNVFISCNPVYNLIDTGFDHKANLYYWPGGSSTVNVGITINTTETSNTDPLFGKITASGYSIDPKSPARDTGVITGFSFDYLGEPVPYNSLHDRGAIEAQSL